MIPQGGTQIILLTPKHLSYIIIHVRYDQKRFFSQFD